MTIREVDFTDIPAWRAVSAGYDEEVLALVKDLDSWYQGDRDSMAFDAYMRAKITQKEAFLAVDDAGCCAGIIAFSTHGNRITFFGIARSADVLSVGGALLEYALARLDVSRGIGIHLLQTGSPWSKQHEALFAEHGFAPCGDAVENGVPVRAFIKLPEQTSI